MKRNVSAHVNVHLYNVIGVTLSVVSVIVCTRYGRAWIWVEEMGTSSGCLKESVGFAKDRKQSAEVLHCIVGRPTYRAVFDSPARMMPV